jgi:hypothetical protein
MTNLSRRRFLQLAAGVGAVSAVPGFRRAALADPLPPTARWLAGDFHVHTTLSHDVWSGPGDDNTTIDEFYTFGFTPGQQIRNAEKRGLQFVALTDHDRVEALHLPEYRSSKLILVPGYEHSTRHGHAGIFVPSVSDLPTIITKETAAELDPDGLTRIIGDVHGRGGMVVLNHPKGGTTPYSWGYDIAASHAVDAVEVWNSQWLQREDTIPISPSNNQLAIAWWEREFLDKGARRGAVGGSDNHWRSTFSIQGVGQPTTYVLATSGTAAGIIEAVQAGRTTVSWQPPVLGGAQLIMTATEQYGDHRSAQIGGEVRPLGPVDVTVRIRKGLGHRLRLISSGQVIGNFLVAGHDVTHTSHVVLPAGGWVRAELYLDPGYAMTAVTSPIWAGAEAAPAAVQRPVTTGVPIDYGHDLTIPQIASTHCC